MKVEKMSRKAMISAAVVLAFALCLGMAASHTDGLLQSRQAAQSEAEAGSGTRSAGTIYGRTFTYQGSKEADAVSFEIWTFFDMNTPDSYYVTLWEELARKNKCNITINTYSSQRIKDKLKIAAAGKALPDIFLVWGGTYPDYLFDSGSCIPVQDYLKDSGISFRSSYIRKYKDGNNYIIPCLPEAYGVTYANENLLQEMHLTIPKNWKELVRFVKKVNQYNEAHDTDYAAIELGDKDDWLGELLYCNAVNSIDPQAFDKLRSGKISFQDEVFQEAADKVKKLIDLQAFPENYLDIGEVEAVSDFADGRAVLFPHQSTIVYYLQKNMGENAFSVHGFPSFRTKERKDANSCIIDINHTLTPGLCISSSCKNQDAAAHLCLQFAKKVNHDNVSEYGYLNMTESEIKMPENISAPVRQMRSLVFHAKKYTPLWYAVLPSDQAEEWRELTKKFFAGEYGTDEFLKLGEKYF